MEMSLDDILLFRKKIDSFYHLSDQSFQKFSSILHKKKYRKGEVILREGETCKGFWYIIKGCIRSFSVEDGLDINLTFYFDDEIASDFYSLRAKKPSKYFFIALEPCETLYFDQKEIVELFSDDLEFIHFSFRFYQERFLKERSHSNSFKLMNPEERYRYLLENKPHYLQRIPLTYLASYMGMSRETLSRIRKKF